MSLVEHMAPDPRDGAAATGTSAAQARRARRAATIAAGSDDGGRPRPRQRAAEHERIGRCGSWVSPFLRVPCHLSRHGSRRRPRVGRVCWGSSHGRGHRWRSRGLGRRRSSRGVGGQKGQQLRARAECRRLSRGDVLDPPLPPSGRRRPFAELHDERPVDRQGGRGRSPAALRRAPSAARVAGRVVAHGRYGTGAGGGTAVPGRWNRVEYSRRAVQMEARVRGCSTSAPSASTSGRVD